MRIRISKSTLAGIVLTCCLLPVPAIADSGFYVGGAAGGATLEIDLGDTGIPGLPLGDIDEDDTAFKVFAGYNFDLPVIDLGIEAGYVDFGAPELDTALGQVELDPTGINLWGIASFDAGLVDLYAKLGYIFWDVEVSSPVTSATEDGSDLGYGAGLSFSLGSVKIRGELELYELDDVDLSMLSLGVLYQFD
jgi:hypothetical protein